MGLIFNLQDASTTKGDKNMEISIFDHNKLNRNAFYVEELDVLFVADTVSEEEKQSLIQQCGK